MLRVDGGSGISLEVIDPRADGAWPDAVPPGIRRYLTALSGDGPARMVENAKGVRGEILRVGDTVLPVLVSDGAPGKASILSPIGHHFRYPAEEIGRRSRILGRRGWAAIVFPLEIAFRAGALDRVAFVNHWLMSGSPEPTVSHRAWPAIFSYLARRHPRHAILVQDIDLHLHAETARALEAAGTFPVATRIVGVLDPSLPLGGGRFKSVRHAQSRGRRLIEGAAPDLLTPGDTLRQCEALVRLYRRSNIERHSALNPAYTAEFFRTALRCEEFIIHAWRAPGAANDDVAAFGLCRTDARSIHWATFGREPDSDGVARYYERITATDVALALKRQLVLRWGAGADEHKRFRGAVAHAEIAEVFVSHLPPRQRAAWRLLALLRRIRHGQRARHLPAEPRVPQGADAPSSPGPRRGLGRSGRA